MTGVHTAPVFLAAASARACAVKKSVPSGRSGPCCSVEPTGIRAVFFFLKIFRAVFHEEFSSILPTGMVVTVVVAIIIACYGMKWLLGKFSMCGTNGAGSSIRTQILLVAYAQ